MVAEKVHIDSIKITRKYNEFVCFYSCPRAKLSSGFLPISSKQLFLKIYFSPVQKREDYLAEKMTKN